MRYGGSTSRHLALATHTYHDPCTCDSDASDSLYVSAASNSFDNLFYSVHYFVIKSVDISQMPTCSVSRCTSKSSGKSEIENECVAGRTAKVRTEFSGY